MSCNGKHDGRFYQHRKKHRIIIVDLADVAALDGSETSEGELRVYLVGPDGKSLLALLLEDWSEFDMLFGRWREARVAQGGEVNMELRG